MNPAPPVTRITSSPTRGGRGRSFSGKATLSTLEGGRQRARQDPEVEPHRPAIDIFEVRGDPAIEVGISPRPDLPEASNPRLHRQAPAVPDVVSGDLVQERGPRSDEAHLAAQDVPQLWQLIDARPTDPPSGTRDPRIVGDLEGPPVHLVPIVDFGASGLRVARHGPEFQDREHAALEPHPTLP